MDGMEDLEVEEGDNKAALVAKLQTAKERLAALSKKGGIVVPKEKKVAKFSGKGDFTQWKEDIESVLTRFSKETDKAAFVFDHLEGPAKVEIKFHLDIKKSTAVEILELLQSIYASHDNVIQLQQQFFATDHFS